MERILFIDTETGGVTPEESSLLSIGLAVWQNGTVIDSTELKIYQNIYKVSPISLRINKINLLEFSKDAMKPKDVINSINEFCSRNFPSDNQITLAGHNVSFDISFLKHFYKENGGDFSKVFSHRSIDTASILKYLYLKGSLPYDISSSDKAFSYFNIVTKERHTALDDVISTAELFSKLISL